MIIRRLVIKNFKRFPEKELKFKSGLNVIHGKNEQGKSTIAEALLLSLYGNPTVHSQLFQERYRSWQSAGDIIISIDFSVGSENFSIEKNFTANTFLFKDYQVNKTFDNYKEVAPKFYEKLGISTPELYKSTAYITHQDLTKIHETKSLAESIKEAIVGMGEVKVNYALKTLEKTLVELNKGLFAVSKIPGIIKHLKTTIECKEKELEDVRVRVEKLRKAVEEKKDSSGRVEEIENKIKKLEQEIKDYETRVSAEKEIKAIEEKSEMLERDIQAVRELEAELAQQSRELKKFEGFLKVNIHDIERKITAIRKERQTVEARLERKEFVPTEEKPKPGIFDLVLVGLGVTVGVITGLVSRPILGTLIFFLCVGLAGVKYAIRWSSYRLKISQQEAEFKRKVVEAGMRIKELNQKETEILTPVGVKSFEELVQKKAQCENISLKIDELKKSIAGYLQGRKIHDMEKEQLRLFTKKKEIEVSKLTDKVRAAKMSESEFYRKKADLEMFRLELRDLMERKGASEARIQDSTVSIDDVSALEEEIAALKKELAYYERKARILRLAKIGIEEARSEMIENSTQFIDAGVEKYLPLITEGRYDQVRVSPELKIEVYSKEKGDWVDPDQALSRGTVDQIYFAFRLALLKVVATGKAIPIILDDPFLTFDEVRLASTKRLLALWSKEHQIFLLTCRREYTDWGITTEI